MDMGLRNESIEEAEILMIRRKKNEVVWTFTDWKEAINPNTFHKWLC